MGGGGIKRVNSELHHGVMKRSLKLGLEFKNVHHATYKLKLNPISARPFLLTIFFYSLFLGRDLKGLG